VDTELAVRDVDWRFKPVREEKDEGSRGVGSVSWGRATDTALQMEGTAESRAWDKPSAEQSALCMLSHSRST
jgi:hypothetical protein